MLINTNPRPNRFEEEKDEDYHVRYARWCIGSFDTFYYQDFVARYMTNIAFYKGNQWIFDEDLDPFLMDESGNVRNRIKWVQNIVKPFVEYYRGAAIRMDLNAEVVSMSREAKSRRDRALDRVLFWSRMAKKMAQEGNAQGANMIQEQFGVSANESETVETFNNLYTDDIVKAMSNLRQYIADVRNNVSGLRMKLAEDLALSGLGVLKEVDFNGEQIWQRTAPERFIFDNTAESDTLDDADYMGEFTLASATDIYEMHPNIDLATKKAIEAAISLGSLGLGVHNMMSFYMNYAEKVPLYEIYWRDVSVAKHAAFYDEYGYPVLEEVTEERPLSAAIPVKELEQFVSGYGWIKTFLNPNSKTIKNNYRTIETEQIRFCKFIPGEYINGGKDIVLDYGTRKYSQKNRLRYTKPDYPYKAATYSYILGEIGSPVDSIISPQRFLNRTLSVAESHINNSRGSGTVIDLDSVDMQGGEDEIQSNMNMSRPVYVRAQRQVNNVIGSYDATIKGGTLTLFDIASRMKQIANDTVGAGQQLSGQEGAYRATGSVAQMNLAQGVIMQEPFFNAIEKIYMQSYNSMVNRGKRIYLSNHRQLEFVVGDEGLVVLELSDEFLLEDFNAKVIRNADFYTERDAANQMLMIFRDKGMIDDKTFSANFNSTTMAGVAYALRSYTGLKVEAEKQQAKMAGQQAEITNQQIRASEELQEAKADKQRMFEKELQDSKNTTKLIGDAINASAREKPVES